MEIIVILLLIYFVVSVSRAAQEHEKKKIQDVIEVKQCPPHKWYYHEIKDTEGNTLTWKLVCKVCGPLKPIN
jgi:hypothetical protein